MTAPLVVVERLSAVYAGRSGAGPVTALRDVSLTLARGETLGLVGASGSGKSTLARALLGFVPEARGSIRIGGHEVIGASQRSLRSLRMHAQMVFQDSSAAFDPRMRIGASVGEALRVPGRVRGAAEKQAVAALLATVGLVAGDADAYPAELSGGQRQRAGIARALALAPELIIWDEALSALDVTVRAQMVNLLLELQARRGLTSLFISHDLAVVRHVADRIAVIDRGEIVEVATPDALFAAPRHAATVRLVAATMRGWDHSSSKRPCSACL